MLFIVTDLDRKPLVVYAKNAMGNGACIYFRCSATTHWRLNSPVCDSYVRPETLVRICDECNFGTYGGRCIICGSPGQYSSKSHLEPIF